MMRICLISTTYRPRTGGLETHVTTLAEALAARGADVTVLTNRDDATQPVCSIEAGVRILRTGALLTDPSGPEKVPWEEALFGLLGDVDSLLDGERFDVVHTHTQAALLLTAMSGLNGRAPVVASFHETEPERDPCGPARSRFVMTHAQPELVLAGSRVFAEQAVAFGAPPGRVRLVHHGLPPVSHQDRRQARALLSAQTDVPEDGVLVTLVGRFKPRKGQLRLLEAYGRMATRGQARLLLIGSRNSTGGGYLAEVLRHVTASGVQDRVTVLDSCPDSVRDTAWAATDVATQPSTREGLGLACIEAMRAGVPVVASDIDGLREVVTNATGLLVDTANPDAYAGTLDELVRSPGRRSLLGACGRTRAQQVFSLDRAVERTLDVYAEAVHLRSGSGGTARRIAGAQR